MNSLERHILDAVGVIIGIWVGGKTVQIFGAHLFKAALLGVGLIVIALVMLHYAYVYPFSPNNNVWGYAYGFGYNVLALCGMTLVGDVVSTLWKSRQRSLLRRSGRP